jgi:predicted nicotinamide N-methyase
MNSQCAQRELVLERTHSKTCNRRFEKEQLTLVPTHFTHWLEAKGPVNSGYLDRIAPMYTWLQQLDFASNAAKHSDALVERITDTIQRFP